jgi:GTPase
MEVETDKLHIAVVGRANVGKSLLINCIFNLKPLQSNSISGDFTENISREVELLPKGSVVIIDFACIDNKTDFDKQIKDKTLKAISLADFAIIVLDARIALNKSETDLITFIRSIKIPFLVVVNKIEFGINPHLLTELEALEVTHFEISCKEDAGIESFKKKLVHMLPS